jgi:hypothetical protein
MMGPARRRADDPGIHVLFDARKGVDGRDFRANAR